MWEKYKNLFEIRVEGSSTKKNMILKLAEGTKLIDYQIDMISKNEKAGLIPFDVRQVNGIDEIYYRTDDMKSFREYIVNNGMTGSEFVVMLKNSLKLIIECEALLLDSHRFLIYPDYSFVNSKGTLQIMYIPAEEFDISISDSMLAFVEVFKENMNKRFEDVQIGKTLTEDLGQGPLSIQELDKVLSKTIGTGDISSGKMEKTAKETSVKPSVQKAEIKPKVNEPVKISNTGNRANQRHMEKIRSASLERIDVQKSFAVNKEPEIKVRTAGKETKKEKGNNGSANMIALIGIQVLILLIIGGAIFTGASDSLDMMQKFGVVIILFALDYLVSRKLMGEKSKENINEKISKVGKKSKTNAKQGKRAPAQKINIGIMEAERTPAKDSFKEVSPMPEKNSGLKLNLDYENEKTEMQESTMMLEDESTVILDDEATVLLHSSAYIVDRVAGNGEKIYIDADPFLIGRKRGVANLVCDNPNISSRHAEISFEGDSYCICDLGSTNGTMLNGNKIEPNEKYMLSDGDIFTLAKSDYVFNIEE